MENILYLDPIGISDIYHDRDSDTLCILPTEPLIREEDDW
jgi:hypothetical protein